MRKQEGEGMEYHYDACALVTTSLYLLQLLRSLRRLRLLRSLRLLRLLRLLRCLIALQVEYHYLSSLSLLSSLLVPLSHSLSHDNIITDSMELLFQEFNTTLESENKVREDVKKITKEIDQTSRVLSGLLQTIHNRGANSMYHFI